jgi:hypothetical protein
MFLPGNEELILTVISLHHFRAVSDRTAIIVRIRLCLFPAPPAYAHVLEATRRLPIAPHPPAYIILYFIFPKGTYCRLPTLLFCTG